MIGIVDLAISNIKSVQNILRKAGADFFVSSQAQDFAKCRKLVLPGVGSFDAGVRRIDDLGLRIFLTDFALDPENELLGICLGMQLLATSSEEGSLKGLNLVPGRSKKFTPPATQPDLKVPNMGWREVTVKKEHRILSNLQNPRFYFVHSYFLDCDQAEDVLLASTHGNIFAAGVSRGGVTGLQFHPEKSHRFGLKIFENFCAGTK